VGDDLHVTVPHAPEVVEEEDVAVDQAHGPGARQERPSGAPIASVRSSASSGVPNPAAVVVHTHISQTGGRRRRPDYFLLVFSSSSSKKKMVARTYVPVSGCVTGDEWCFAWYCLKSGPRCSALWAQ
jgi:hypothetical protein